MSDSENEGPRPISSHLRDWQKRIEEHRQRMETDPEYRAKVEADEKLRKEEDEKREREQQEKSRLAQIKSRRARAGIPPRVWPMLDAPKETASLRAAVDFAGSDGTLLVLAGGVGCGKTVAACAAAEAYAIAAERKRGNGYGLYECSVRDAAFTKAMELARAGSFDREFWDALEAPRFLVVDDLGTEPLDEKGWALANLAALLDARYDALTKTVLTTNLPFARFKARYCQDGGRLQDRIVEVGSFVEITDASFRGAA